MMLRSGKHGWMLRLPDGFLVVRQCSPESVAHLFKCSDRDPTGLRLLIIGDEVGIELLDIVDRLVSSRLDLSQSLCAVFVEKMEDDDFHLALKKIEREPGGNILDFVQVTHRIIPLEQRLRNIDILRVRRSLADHENLSNAEYLQRLMGLSPQSRGAA